VQFASAATAFAVATIGSFSRTSSTGFAQLPSAFCRPHSSADRAAAQSLPPASFTAIAFNAFATDAA